MSEQFNYKQIPSAEVLEMRWQQVLSQFELWTQIWAENPELAKKSGTRVEELMMPLDAVQQRYAQSWLI
jgi:hypothetical protein